jgi:tetratricopeptide (TPR) repeat protein
MTGATFQRQRLRQARQFEVLEWRAMKISLQALVTWCVAITTVVHISNPSLHAQPERTGNPPVHAESVRPGSSSTGSPEDFERIAKLAGEARDAGRLAEATSLYQQALGLQPDWDEGRWNLGTLLYSSDRYAEAREAFAHLVTRLPKHGPSWAFLGLCEVALRDYERAALDLDKGRMLGLGDNPLLVRVTHYNLGILLNRFGRYEQAFEVLKGFARERNEEPSIIEAIGLATIQMPYLPEEIPPDKREMVLLAGRAGYKMATAAFEEADKLFQELLRRYGDAPNAHFAYGAFLTNWHYPEKGLEEFKRELEVSPDHVPARLYLAHALMQQGDYKAALPLGEQAVKLAPNSGNARYAWGRALLATGDVKRAIEQLELGVKLEPESAGLRFQLATAYRRSGRKRDAARESAEFARLDKIQRRVQDEPPKPPGPTAPPPEAPATPQ